MASYGNSFSSQISRVKENAKNLIQQRGQAAISQVQALARQLADQIIAERDAAALAAATGRVYTTFDTANDVLSNNVSIVTTGLFSGNTGSLLTMSTQSNQTAIQESYFKTILDSDGNPQFSIAYGNFNGSGSKDLTGNLNDDTPSRAIYKQYAQILLPPNDLKFTINGVNTNSIYILNFNRARFKEKIDPGNIEINLAKMAGAGNPIVAAGNDVREIIDDSSLRPGKAGEAGKVYNLISGSIDTGTVIHNQANPIYYGLLFPEYGVAILNGDTLDSQVLFGTNQAAATDGKNMQRLFMSISGSATKTSPANRNYGIQARSSEQVKSSFYFVRVKNAEYNYSNNPSFVTGSFGELKYTTFVNDPQTFITTIGLYNNNRELLAVAKLSQPLLKNKTKETLIKVKLDF
tara:strand:+ start:28506 stop:29723 length:1218 start_codon:yes stop_codon:yes gene_type:complete